jgi:hypothetical protein
VLAFSFLYLKNNQLLKIDRFLYIASIECPIGKNKAHAANRAPYPQAAKPKGENPTAQPGEESWVFTLQG